MQIKYYNSNFKDIKNLDDLDKKIYDTILNLPALNVIFDKNLLSKTINVVKEFELNKKKIVIFGTGGSNLGARAINSINIKKKN